MLEQFSRDGRDTLVVPAPPMGDVGAEVIDDRKRLAALGELELGLPALIGFRSIPIFRRPPAGHSCSNSCFPIVFPMCRWLFVWTAEDWSFNRLNGRFFRQHN